MLCVLKVATLAEGKEWTIENSSARNWTPPQAKSGLSATHRYDPSLYCVWTSSLWMLMLLVTCDAVVVGPVPLQDRITLTLLIKHLRTGWLMMSTPIRSEFVFHFFIHLFIIAFICLMAECLHWPLSRLFLPDLFLYYLSLFVCTYQSSMCFWTVTFFIYLFF